MISDLEQLCLAVGAVSQADVIQLADAVNRRFQALAGAQVVKVYWREEAENGNILNPLTASIANSYAGPEPRPFQVPAEPNGVLSWVFLRGQSLLLTDLKNSDRDAPKFNHASGEYIRPEYLDVHNSPLLDAIMAVPITVRGQIVGVYSVESMTSERFNLRVLGLLRDIARALSPLLWNADVFTYDLKKASRAVAKFLDSIRDFVFDPVILEQDVRSGFIARPFRDEFTRVENALCKLLNGKGVLARHYTPSTHRTLVIDDLIRQVQNSHFSICDITEANPNVIAEVGMVLIAHKPLMLIRRKGDETPIPFDLGHVPVYHYEFGAGDDELRFYDVADRSYQPFSHALDSFLSQLPPEIGFSSAKKHVP